MGIIGHGTNRFPQNAVKKNHEGVERASGASLWAKTLICCTGGQPSLSNLVVEYFILWKHILSLTVKYGGRLLLHNDG